MTARKPQRGRPSEGLVQLRGPRVLPDEAQMARDIATELGTSQSRALRWAIRYAYQHILSTTDHTKCPKDSPCAGATRGLTPKGRQRTPKGTPDPSVTGETPWLQSRIT